MHDVRGIKNMESNDESKTNLELMGPIDRGTTS